MKLLSRPGRAISISLLFEPRDLWVGVYWDKGVSSLLVYICLVPVLPIKIAIHDRAARDRARELGAEG